MNKIEDWEGFVSLAYSHGIFPLVYRTLKEYAHLIPEYIFAHMKQNYMDIVKQNMLMTSELIKVIKILEENGIEAISFKGPVLSQMAYGDVVSRQYCDLDILVKEKDLNKSFELLESIGYCSSLEKTFIYNEIFLRKSSDFQFFNKNNILIEVHWQLFRNEFIKNNTDSLNKNKSQIIKINDHKLLTFSNEFNLIYLCLHASKHSWERIEWIVDIDKTIKDTNLNWEKVLKISVDLKASDELKFGLFLCNKVFNTNLIYKDFFKENDKNYHHTLYKLIEKNVFNNDRKEISQSEIFRFNLMSQKTVLNKIRFLYRSFFLIKDRDIMNKEVVFSNFYYLNRLFRLIKKYF